MSRPLRIDVAGGWYHITARGHNRERIFLDENDRRHFIGLVAESVERFLIEVHAYVLLDNHYHLLIHTPGANTSRALQWLNVSYSIWWNRRHGRCGNVFQGRFKSILVERGSWVLDASVYVHLNPVARQGLQLNKPERAAERRGVGQAPSAAVVQARLEMLRRYPWSSYRAYAGYERAPKWLETKEIWRRSRGREKYRERVEERIRAGEAEGLWMRLKWGVVLGEEGFAERMRQAVRLGRETSGRRVWRQQRRWEDIVRLVEGIRGEGWLGFCDRHGDWGRDLALWAVRKWGGLTLREAGQKAGNMDYTAAAMAIRRLEQRAKRDDRVRAAMWQLQAKCEK